MHRILVTGASGLIGRHTLAPLLAVAEVHTACRTEPPLAKGAIWHRSDLLDQSSRRRLVDAVRPHTVLHMAWETRHGAFWTARSNLDWIAATLEILRLAADRDMSRFIGVGTCFEYAGADCQGRCTERSTPALALTLHGVAKDACRRTLQAFAEAEGLSWAWARPFFIFGPGEPPTRLIPYIVQRLLRGQVAEIRSPAAIRDFTDARDAGAALAALALSDVTGPVNIASGRAVTLGELAAMLGRMLGREHLITAGADSEEPECLVADIGRLTNEVGFRDIRPLEAGLADAVDYWRSQFAEGLGPTQRTR